jgi:hypothetical protein
MKFSGPNMPFSAALTAGIMGGFYGVLTKTNPWCTASVFIMREGLNGLLYRIGLILCDLEWFYKNRSRAKLYAVTNLSANIMTLVLLRRIKLIGEIGSRVFVGLMAVEMVCKCLDFPRYSNDFWI